MRGGQWQVLRLIEGLRDEGVRSMLLASKGSPLFEAAQVKGLPVDGLSLRKAVRGFHCDITHVHDARSHTIEAILGARALVVSRRVAFPIVSRWKYSRARHYIAVSEFVKSMLMAGGVPEEKISVVYDGVPLLEATSEATSEAVTGVQVIAPANAGDPQKGAALALEAARLAGVTLKLSTQLECDLHHAAVFVYVTHNEGLGSAVLLAMSAGVPVIASRVGGLPEVIRDRENGILVDNQPEAIAAAIRQLLDDRHLARRIGSAARQTVIEQFTVNRMVRRTMEVYRQVLL
jgi:hypothetical protein